MWVRVRLHALKVMGITTDGKQLVTFLSILGANGIAVPLSSGFPASELRYILDNCEALMVLSSRKFQGKVEEVAKEGLEHKPIFGTVEKKLEGSRSSQEVRLEKHDAKSNQSGMMLYTSGTTSRPVSQTAVTDSCRRTK